MSEPESPTASSRPRSPRRDLTVTVAVNLGSLVLGLLTGVAIARALEDEGRGLFATVVAWYTIALVVGELGQSAAATFRVASQPGTKATTVASSRWVMLPLSLLVGAVGVVLSPWLANGNATQESALRLACAAVVLNGLGASFVYALQAVSIPAWNGVRLVQSVAYLVVTVALASIGKLTVVTATGALVAAMGLQLAAAYLLGARATLRGGRASGVEVRWLASYGLRQSTSSVPATVAASSDKVALSGAVEAAAIGQYAVAQTVVGTAGAVGTAFSAVGFPRLAAMTSSPRDRVRHERRLLVVSTAAVAAVAIALAAISPLAIPLVYGPSFTAAAGVAWWLVVPVVAQNGSLMTGTILRGRSAPGRAAVAQLAGLGATIAALTVAVPRWQLPGAAMALGFGSAVAFLLGVGFWVRAPDVPS